MRYASVLVTYNRKDLLVEAINSILKQTITPQEVVIVDNNSTDGTREFLEKKGIFDNSLIKYIKLEENVGGAGGFNAGLEYVRDNLDVDWVSVSDDDAIYKTDYFEVIAKKSLENVDIKAFAGSVKFPDGEIQIGHRKLFTNHDRYSAENISENFYKKDFFLADFASFVGLTISTKLLNKIGLPDKDYFIWFDDFEYGIRINKYTKIGVCSNAIIIHKTLKELHGKKKEMKKVFSWKEYYGIRNRILTIKKHGTSVGLAVVLIGYILNTAELIFKRKIEYKSVKEIGIGIKDGIKNVKGKNKNYLP
ncbi:glycosyltransferase family 2 protein [Pediococcus pentosaceus]|uniref:glycosyltransferase family 2 protein n=1 Tax=Pediococcus pentosaceus TaxID=1255 RepID=UPI0025B19C20|nr:glycosyltransferase family 2 protein [Pediococcus pentosaceus]MDN3207599.1 glycosyltransferase family 2 protein [Pediococcus pentosaceus]